LIGMQERVTLYGGTLDARPGTDGSWTVTAVLPVPDEEAP
jgi:signal transduction histidine kinase